MLQSNRNNESSRSSHSREIVVLIVFTMLLLPALAAQKIKTGYDKTIDFSKYKTYSLQPPAEQPSRPLVYASVVGSIENELNSKGIVGMDTDADLTLIAVGGFDYGLSPNANLLSDSCSNCQAPLRDPRPWAGSPPPVSGTSGKPAPRGTLQLSFVERATNKLVWSGTVVQKLNEEKKEESLQRIAAAIKKLLSEFPPRLGR